MLAQQPSIKTGDDFSARLFARIANENFAEKRSRAFLPGRIPFWGASRLAAVAATAVVVLLVGAGINMSHFEGLSPVPLALSTSTTSGGSDNDLYLTVQPTHNPLLNSQKSVSRMVQQYNRWRELSRVIRSHSGAEQFMGNGATAVMAASSNGADAVNVIRIRPVVKNYLVTPENTSPGNKGAVY
jgi:hypothetical protein